MKHIARTLTGLALAAGFAVSLPHDTHAVGGDFPLAGCEKLTGTMTVPGWLRWLEIVLDDGQTARWINPDAPYYDDDTQTATITFPRVEPGVHTYVVTDTNGEKVFPHPAKSVTVTACPVATTTTAPPVTTVAPEPTTTAPAPATTVAPEPSTTTPAETTTSSTAPATTVPPEPSTSATDTTTPQEPVRVTEPTVWLGTAPRPPDAPETSLLRPTPPAAAVTTVQASTTTNGAPNNHTCDDADPPCEPATTAATVTQRTGRHPNTGFELLWLIPAGAVIIYAGKRCRELSLDPRRKA